MSSPDLTSPPANALSPPLNATTPPSTENNSSPPPPETPVVFPAPPLTPASNGSSPPTSLPSPPPHSNSELVALGVGAGIGGAFVLILVGIFVVLYRTRKRRHRLAGSSERPAEEQKGELFNALHLHGKQDILPSKDHVITVLPDPDPPPKFSSKITFTYEELSQATDGFCNANLLGEGGFGYVHKGVLLNGKEVAIKQLKTGSGQGEREFQAEVEFIGRVSHRHLVSLVGYCISGIQRLLVYEFVPNNTLEFHLHGKERQPLCWTRRMKIARGSAKGLAYLHEDCKPKIIHRDIKAVNILLDYDFEAKVADFGLARLNFDADTHISTRVMGTFGYLAPEYALTGKLTDKSDVFSFGVVLLELITGRRPVDKAQFPDGNIVDWARPLLTQALEDGSFDSLVDPRLQKDYDITEMTCMIACASVCVRHLARRRPKLIQIVRALEGNISIEELNDGIRPEESSAYGSHDSLDYDTCQYKEDLRKFRKLALGNKDQATSECSGPTSEFDVRPSASSSEVIQTTQEITSSSEHHRRIPVT